MKTILTISIILVMSLVLSGCNNQNETSENKDNTTSNIENTINITRTSIQNNIKDIENNGNNDDNSSKNDSQNLENKNESSTTPTETNTKDDNNKTTSETELSNFSTPLKSGVANRITNIKLTSGKINEHILKNGETFSFNQIVGPCTSEEGYKKAEIYVNNKIEYALGGGNCQVSTTLYNAAIAVPGITIVERHPHKRSVDYIQSGKDATVSYNTLDLKFKNETGNSIKLYTWCDDVNVCAKITQISSE